MVTWDAFVYFGVAAAVSSAAGAVAALCADDHWSVSSYRYRARRKVAILLSMLSVLILASFIILFWLGLKRPPLRTMGETRLWYSLFALLSGLFTYIR